MGVHCIFICTIHISETDHNKELKIFLKKGKASIPETQCCFTVKLHHIGNVKQLIYEYIPNHSRF